MRRLFFAAVMLLAFGAPNVARAAELKVFPTAAMARKHCPHDTVVWVNLPTMIWHYKGERWYGRTKHGAYACEKEAAAAGARATRNGE